MDHVLNCNKTKKFLVVNSIYKVNWNIFVRAECLLELCVCVCIYTHTHIDKSSVLSGQT